MICIMASPAAAEDARSVADLDGTYVSLGPVASAVHIEGAWDGTFGGEAQITRVQERELISALGLAIGGLRYAERTGGRVWADLSVAHQNRLAPIGLSLGGTVELDDLRAPRWGGQATLWVFAGVLPYLRVAAVQESGVVVDIGLKVVLPALRM